jgi:hypothetical protein
METESRLLRRARSAVALFGAFGQTIGDWRWMGGASSLAEPTEHWNSTKMPISLYASSAGVFVRMLTNLDAIFTKAEASATERKFNPDHFVQMRLAPDMNNFGFQIQAATDRSKLFVARVIGQPAPVWEDNEKTFAEVHARLRKGLDYHKAIEASQLDGLEEKLIPLKIRGEDVQWTALDYLLKNAMPNFYFHVTTAYDLLRHAGVPIGKRDFTG